jgi:2-dehydro-3-deoxyphosphogluconate aldolase/(4S)-4-hydroxy-2-oxoglutarate aldolase
MNPILERLGNCGLVPVVKIDDAAKAEALGKALMDGGLPCAEITFRSEAAAPAIKAMTGAFPGLLVGAGTVINVELAKKAAEAGAQFIVSPGFNPEVVDWCLAHQLTVVPGINNPSGVEAGLARGLTVLKFFPAEASGGTAMLEALAGPFPQVSFMPTGGIGLSNLADYACLPNVHAIGGSWMVKPELIEKADWPGIVRLCREAALAVHGFGLAHLGINSPDETEADQTASLLGLFGLPPKIGNASIFCGSVIEVMKTPFRGTHGHIGFSCWNVERAAAWLGQFGFRTVPETAKILNGRLAVVYLDREIGGFAIHLTRAR